MNRWSAIIVLLFLSATCSQAQRRFVVRLATSAQLPAESLATKPRPAVVAMLSSPKTEERQQSSEEMALLERLNRYVVIDIPSSADPSALLNVPGVESVRPLTRFRLHDVVLTDDSLSDRQYALHRIGAAKAWTRATGKGTVVGIIDTGIDWTHEDLVDALDISSKEDRNGNRRFDPWASTDTLGGVPGDLDGLDNDGNGVIDDVIGIDVVDQSVRNLGDDRYYDPIPFDEQGHGTLVGGVVAATPNNRKGIAGLAYDARLRIVRAFDATGNAEEDDIATAIVYLAQQGVDVINMSFGDGVDSPLMRDAVRYAAARGCVLVASAGNTGTISRQFPAGYDEVISVASTNDENRRSPFSSTGPLVALSAPGQAIVTTSVGSRYRSVNGTSFSAPFVAATIAMMRERFPTMPISNIRATLQQRSVDLGQPGWDDLFGAGLLQADAALSDGAWSRVEITSPANEAEIDPLRTPEIEVTGSTMLASFAGTEIAWGEGLSPRTWTTFSRRPTAVRDGLIARVLLPQTASQLVTLRVRVLSSDGRPLDVFRRIRLVDSSRFAILATEVVSAWKTDRRTSVVTVTTNRPCSCAILTDDASITLAESTGRSRRHSIIVPDTFVSRGDRSIRLRCAPDVGVSWDTTLSLATVSQGAGADAAWRSAGSAPWTGYVLNDVRDIYLDGVPTVVMCDLANGSFGGLVTRQLVNGTWISRDSIPEVYIPRGIGDANGNGLLDVLVHSVGKVVLLEQQQAGGSPFARVIFADTTGQLNAAGLADIDGDGREEIVALADDGAQVFAYSGSTFRLLGSVENPTPPAANNARNRVDEISIGSGDFDGDGRMEIAFGDTDGDLVIAEWSGTSFQVTHTMTSQGVGGSGFVASGDVTGDGRPDVFFGVPDDTEADENGDYGRSLWTYTLLQSSGNDAFTSAWSERIAGVRYGIGYRNGVTIGQLDDQPGQEMTLCAFPRLYVFGRSAVGSDTMIACKRFIDDVASPRVLVHDLDADGRNELGYGVTVSEVGAMTSFAFTQALPTKKVAAPMSLRARWLGDSVVLDWFTPTDSAECVLFQALPGGAFRRMSSSTANTSTVGRADLDGPVVRFAVRAVVSAPNGLSESSNIVTVFRGDDAVRFALERDFVKESECRAGMQLHVVSSNDLDLTSLSRESVQIGVSAGTTSAAHSVVPRTTRDVVVSLPGIEPGDSIALKLTGLRLATGVGVSDTTLHLQVVADPDVL
ncbi:MAG: S8 family serine peptidase, partial [Candidatus Kapaibacterium sp.]